MEAGSVVVATTSVTISLLGLLKCAVGQKLLFLNMRGPEALLTPLIRCAKPAKFISFHFLWIFFGQKGKGIGLFKIEIGLFFLFVFAFFSFSFFLLDMILSYF